MELKLKAGKKAEASGSSIKVIGEKFVDINSIHEWKGNPRKNDQAVEPLMKIIKQHGQVSPVVVWNKNNVVYKGNTTLKAMRKLGLKGIRALFVSFPSDAAAAAYAIDDNKAGEYSEWDANILKRLMQAENLKDSVVGFSPVERNIFNEILDVKVIEKYDEDKDMFEICVEVPPKDKEKILKIINEVLNEGGFTYVAKAY